MGGKRKLDPNASKSLEPTEDSPRALRSSRLPATSSVPSALNDTKSSDVSRPKKRATKKRSPSQQVAITQSDSADTFVSPSPLANDSLPQPSAAPISDLASNHLNSPFVATESREDPSTPFSDSQTAVSTSSALNSPLVTSPSEDVNSVPTGSGSIDQSFSIGSTTTNRDDASPSSVSQSVGAATTVSAKKTRAPMGNRSQFMQYFTVNPSDDTKLDCTLCGHSYVYLYGEKRMKVTSGLKNHLKSVHPEQFGVVVSREGNHLLAKQWLLRAIATGSLAFNIAQNVEIREFLKCLDPTFVVPDRKTLSGTILDAEYVVARRAVCDAVRGEHISITMDHWTSKDSNHSVMGSTAHIITPSWQRELYVLTLDEIEGSHNSAQVSAFLSDVKREFELGSVYCCLSDNASVMTAGTAKAGVNRVGCVLHATHLFIMESIDSWKIATDIVFAIRKIAAHVHRSRNSWMALLRALIELNCANRKKIPMEIRIRWGSMLRMLRVAADQIDPLSELAAEHGLPVLNDGQKMTLRRLVDFLSSVDSFSATMSTHTATLSSVIPYLRGLENSMTGYSTSSLKDFIPILQQNFTKRFTFYFENEFAQKALLLDPRFLHWGTLLTPADEEAKLQSIFEEADRDHQSTDTSPPVPKKARPSLLAAIAPKMAPPPTGAKLEYEKLVSLARKVQFSEERDPVEFWRDHHLLFPRLARVARILLAIPPSSIDSERLFSAVGLVVNNRLRSRTNSYRMKKLAFVGAHARRGRIRFRPDEWESHFEGDDEGVSDSEELEEATSAI